MLCIHVSHTIIRDFPKVVSGIQKGGWPLCTPTPAPPPSNDSLYQIPPFLFPPFAQHLLPVHFLWALRPQHTQTLWGNMVRAQSPGAHKGLLSLLPGAGPALGEDEAKVGPGGLRGTLEQEINRDRGIEKLG